MFERHKLQRTVHVLLTAITASVLLLPLQAQSTHDAKIIDLVGRVSMLQNERFEKALFMGDGIRPGTVIICGPDGFARVQVPDGSTFEVFPNTRVLYRERGYSVGDLLNVIIGRVKVFVQHDQGPNPNKVTTPTAVISVRGTVFDVIVKSDDETVVTVDEGEVEVKNLTAEGNPVTLTPNGRNAITVFRGQPIARASNPGRGFQQILQKTRDAIVQIAIQQRTGGSPIPGGRTPTPTGGPQGDQNGKQPPPATPPGPGSSGNPGTPPGPGGN